MGTSKNPVVPANDHKGHAGPVPKFSTIAGDKSKLDPGLRRGDRNLRFREVLKQGISIDSVGKKCACLTLPPHASSIRRHTRHSFKYLLHRCRLDQIRIRSRRKCLALGLLIVHAGEHHKPAFHIGSESQVIQKTDAG